MRIHPKGFQQMTALLERETSDLRIPGAVVAVGIGCDVLYREAFGYAENLRGHVRAMHHDTIFDLASLTKVVATLPSILTLIDNGHIRLNDPVSLFLPEFTTEAKSTVTLRHLLTHTSGLPASRLFYKMHTTPHAILEAVRREPLEHAPGAQVVYSDLGFVLLGDIVRAVTGMPLDQYAEKQIFQPLGMKTTGYCPPPEFKPWIAATEEMDGQPAKVGVVHDENAEALGGVAGHAGLFASMSDLIQYVSMWLNPTADVLSPAVRRVAVQCHTEGLNGRRGIGWVCRHDAYDHTGDLWPETTVGHTGFTGTSLAFDPVSKLWMILLTNDVHYGREKKHIVRLRGLLHNLIGSSLIE
jgi:CubicO group peptidase (beta-lactamase class C family)